MRELALFAGAGGGILGGRLLGWRTVCAVEIDPYARRVLLARQADGCLGRFPIWDDVRTFDGTRWRGTVDVISGGFPCQDISAAGKGAGITGAKSGLWSHMARIIGEVRPRFVFVENSPLLVSRGLAVVLGDLAAMGYDARWGVLGAHHVGAPHKRHRLWIVAYHGRRWGQENELCAGRDELGIRGAELANADSKRKSQSERRIETQRRRLGDSGEKLADSDKQHVDGWRHGASTTCGQRQDTANLSGSKSIWWHSEPDVGRVANGVAHGVDRLRCLGNGQVPAVVALAWRILSSKRNLDD